MKKDDKYKQELSDFINKHGKESAFSYAIDLIVNSTGLEAMFLDPKGEFFIMCKPEYLEQLHLMLGIDMKHSRIGYAQEEDDEKVLYPEFKNKDDKVH